MIKKGSGPARGEPNPYVTYHTLKQNQPWLNVDSGQFILLRHQQFQKGSEQTFAPEAGVVDELKETRVERSCVCAARHLPNELGIAN